VSPAACVAMVNACRRAARIERALGSRARRAMLHAEARYWIARAHGRTHAEALAAADASYRRAA